MTLFDLNQLKLSITMLGLVYRSLSLAEVEELEAEGLEVKVNSISSWGNGRRNCTITARRDH